LAVASGQLFVRPGRTLRQERPADREFA